ncbi:MAG: DUF3772 domain-containing protein, partial [Beijerinckiaceae bacterium]
MKNFHFLKITGAVVVLAASLLIAIVSAMAQEAPKAQLDRFRAAISEMEREVQANLGNDRKLGEARGKLDPIRDQIREFIAEQTPRLEGIKARLEQLGPKPDTSKGHADNADVARERDEQEKARGETEAYLALARNEIVAAEQLSSTISDTRRTLLTKALLERSTSVFSPVLWLDVVRALPGELRSAQFLLGGWWDHIIGKLDLVRLVMLVVFVVFLAVVAVPGNRYLRRFEGRPEIPAPADTDGKKGSVGATRLKRALAALRVIVIWAVVPVLVCASIYNVLDSLGLISDRVENIIRTLLFGIAFVAFAHGLADGVLGPDDPQWRLMDVDDRTASKITHLASAFTGIIVAGKTVEAVNQAIFALLPVTVATKSLFALFGALAIIRTLRQLRSSIDDETATEKPLDAGSTTIAGGVNQAARLSAWVAAASILAAAVFGYVALAGFLADQVIWLAIVGAILVILLTLVDEFMGGIVAPEGPLGKQIVSQVGISKSSLK